MEKKINIAEILKDCPRGTKLYSPLCGECYFDRLHMGTIICKKQNTQEIAFTSKGYYMLPVFDDCECVLLPSITNISNDGMYKVEYQGHGISYVNLVYQDEWELVHGKFDINTLKPFDKVLVRGIDGIWAINFFGFYDENKKEFPFHCIGQTVTRWGQCIPYEGNEHLLGKTDNCNEFYKAWK